MIQELNLFEADYFGIRFQDEEGNECWIDPRKNLKENGIKIQSRQPLQFGVKEKD